MRGMQRKGRQRGVRAAVARFWGMCGVVGGGRGGFLCARDVAVGGSVGFEVGDGWSALGCLARGCVGAGAGAGGVWGC